MRVKPAIAMVAAIILAGCVSPQSQGGAVFGYQQSVRSGMKTRAGDYFSTAWDGRTCQPRALPEISVVRAPASGHFIIERGRGRFNAEPGDSPRSAACIGKYYPAMVIYYQSRPGFRGEDRGAYKVIYANGETNVFEKKFRVQ